MIPINDTPSGASFSVRVQPRARHTGISGELGAALKIALTVPPVNGRANQACIEFLAETLGVPRSSVTIAAGEASRNKVIRVTGLTAAEVRRRLETLTPRKRRFAWKLPRACAKFARDSSALFGLPTLARSSSG